MTPILTQNYFRIYLIILGLISALLPAVEVLKVKALSFAFILLVVWFLITGDWHNKWKRLKENRLAWLLGALYLINLVSFTYSDNPTYALDLLVRKMPILFFPFIVAASPTLPKQYVNKLAAVFVISLLITSLYTYRDGIAPLLERNDLTELVRLVPMHRPYLGMFSAFAIIISLSFALNCKNVLAKLIASSVAFYFLWYIYVIYAKMTVVALLVLGITIGLIYLFKKFHTYVALLVVLAVFSGIITYLSTSEQATIVYKKVIALEDFSYDEYNIHLVSSINIRYINWGCSIKILNQDKTWFTGLGLGDSQEKLLSCYKELNPWIYEQRHNAHNEYLEETLRNGIIGLMILLACLIVPLSLCIYHKYYVCLSFILLFGICCLSESILSRQAGIMFYAFFSSLYILNSLRSLNGAKKPTLIHN